MIEGKFTIRLHSSAGLWIDPHLRVRNFVIFRTTDRISVQAYRSLHSEDRGTVWAVA
jgi:hypothetical protein